jgi:thiol-disulfide isomerase/thioredoxin
VKKKILALIMATIVTFSLVGCGKSKGKESENKGKTETSELVEKNDEEKNDEEKKKQGWKKYNDMGIEFKMADVWKNYGDNILLGGLGDPDNPEEPIYGGLRYSFLSNELIKQYETVSETEKDPKEKSNKITEIFSKATPLFDVIVYREDKVPTEEKLPEETGKKNNNKIAAHDGLVFYICYDDFNDSELSEGGKTAYKELYDDIKNIKESITTFKPITPQEAITALNKIEFKLKDLDGKEIDSKELFKDNKITMVNIWATFCGPCINEMPDLQKLFEEVEANGGSVIGIIGDTPDEDNEIAAKKIIETKGVKFVNLIPDDKFKKEVISSIAGYPTSFFVDSEGKIVGEVVTGSRSKEDYKEILNKAIESLK